MKSTIEKRPYFATLDMQNNNATGVFPISALPCKIVSANNGNVGLIYEIVKANDSAGSLFVHKVTETSSVNVHLSFAKSGNNVVVTNSGNWGARLYIIGWGGKIPINHLCRRWAA